MGYIENNLVPGEKLVFKTGLHWWVIVPATIYFLILAWIFAFLLDVFMVSSGTPSSRTSQMSSFALGTSCSLPVFILSVILGILNVISSEFGVTNRRVMIKTGILRRKTLEMNLSKLESFQIHESIFGRLIGYKAIVVTGSGGTQQKFSFVAKAREFQQRVVELSTSNNFEYEDSRGRAFNPQPAPVQVANPYTTTSRPISPNQSVLDQISLPSQDPRALIETAINHIRAGNQEAAKETVKSLMSVAPQNADAWYLAGYLATSPRKKKEAFERALSIDPRHKKAREGLDSLG